MTRPRPARPILAAALAGLTILPAPHPAAAQGELRTVTVPPDGPVVIPPRSAPRLAARPAGTGGGVPIPPGGEKPVLLPDLGTGLGVPGLGFILPAIAGALLGGTLAGARNGGSAPARTR